MAEPHSSTAGGIITGASIGLTGTIMGAQLDALVIGMFAATMMSIWLPSINDRLKSAAAVAMASILAGYSHPVAIWLSRSFESVDYSDPLRLLMAAIIGMAVPALLPDILTRVRALIDGGKP